ncbi:hypothetical protein AVEN_252353-1 [Araneus ventricosus]|uniref:Uncharacterized protein n=1 Tax=Araneus ventricosus TaxID=182803 RepID=A0A4Y2ARN2_ARAVE|nr:hypothetical protein AVEN_252353-1 [Araneus ventricosus]
MGPKSLGFGARGPQARNPIPPKIRRVYGPAASQVEGQMPSRSCDVERGRHLTAVQNDEVRQPPGCVKQGVNITKTYKNEASKVNKSVSLATISQINSV